MFSLGLSSKELSFILKDMRLEEEETNAEITLSDGEDDADVEADGINAACDAGDTFEENHYAAALLLTLVLTLT